MTAYPPDLGRAGNGPYRLLRGFGDSLVQRFLAESQNGMMHVNHGTVPDNNMPFGGVKNSGVGAYSVGPTAVNFYTSEHAAYIAY